MEIYKSGTVIAGRYEIVKMVGAGGMGVVYFAVDHKQDGLPVVLKTFHRELLIKRKACDQFLSEAEINIDFESKSAYCKPHGTNEFAVIGLRAST